MMDALHVCKDCHFTDHGEGGREGVYWIDSKKKTMRLEHRVQFDKAYHKFDLV